MIVIVESLFEYWVMPYQQHISLTFHELVSHKDILFRKYRIRYSLWQLQALRGSVLLPSQPNRIFLSSLQIRSLKEC